MNDDEYDEDYYEQSEFQEWCEYVEDCVDSGCLKCGHEVGWGDVLSYHNCIYCE